MIGLTTGRHPQSEIAYSLESAAHSKWSAAPSKPMNYCFQDSKTYHRRHCSHSKGLHWTAICQIFQGHQQFLISFCV